MQTLRSDREISMMRRAGLVVWQAHQIAREMIGPGATSQAIDAAIEAYFDKCGVEPLFKDYPHQSKGRPAFPAVTCMSKNDEIVHGIPNDQPLKEGDILSIDTGCRLDGWCGDAAVTHAIGQVSPELQRLLDVTQGALRIAFETMATAQRWSEVAEKMDRHVRDAGFSTVEDFVGHGIGREMHEKPEVPNFLSRGLRGAGDFRIEPGLVIAVEPMVNLGTKHVRALSDHWTQSTRDGKPSAHFEHTIAMTQAGPKLLTGPPSDDERDLVIPP